MLGQGSYGLVIKGRNRETKKEVAIKKVKCDLKNLKQIKYVMREITILRQLTKMDNCIFFPKLYDIIIPEKYQDRV
jgi:serine/threonine protein kinase